MLHTCPNHELAREIILQNFYARFSHNDQSMLDTSSAGSFMKRTIESRWDLLERIKRNYEDWEIDKGNESGINLEFDCVSLLWKPMLFTSLALSMDLTQR